jgi:hypothetical protein
MRGQDGRTGSMFSYVDMEDRIPAHHSLRKIREFVNAALAALASCRLFAISSRRIGSGVSDPEPTAFQVCGILLRRMNKPRGASIPLDAQSAPR